MGGADCTGVGSVSPSRLCFVNTEGATCSSCTVEAGAMGGAACTGVGSVSPSRLCFVNTEGATCSSCAVEAGVMGGRDGRSRLHGRRFSVALATMFREHRRSNVLVLHC